MPKQSSFGVRRPRSLFARCRTASVLLAHASVLTLVLLALVLTAAREADAQEQPNFWAVVIGVSEFENLPKEEWLQFADRDATSFAQFITSPRGRNFPPENVFLLTNKDALSQAIRSRL